MKEQDTTRNKFPGVLWLLPVFLGLFGGIIAALISNLKYQASWWELFAVGLAITFISGIIYILFLALLFSSPY